MTARSPPRSPCARHAVTMIFVEIRTIGDDLHRRADGSGRRDDIYVEGLGDQRGRGRPFSRGEAPPYKPRPPKWSSHASRPARSPNRIPCCVLLSLYPTTVIDQRSISRSHPSPRDCNVWARSWPRQDGQPFERILVYPARVNGKFDGRG
jgi:hypothetical protein